MSTRRTDCFLDLYRAYRDAGAAPARAETLAQEEAEIVTWFAEHHVRTVTRPDGGHERAVRTATVAVDDAEVTVALEAEPCPDPLLLDALDPELLRACRDGHARLAQACVNVRVGGHSRVVELCGLEERAGMAVEAWQRAVHQAATSDDVRHARRCLAAEQWQDDVCRAGEARRRIRAEQLGAMGDVERAIEEDLDQQEPPFGRG